MNQLSLTNIKNSFVFLLYLIALLSCENESSYIAVTNVTLNTTHVNLAEGEEYMLTATISPYNATNKNLIWFSSDGSVANVIDGRVIARKRGEAIITTQTDDGAKTATCLVTVTDENEDTTGSGSNPETPEQPGGPEFQSGKYFIMDGKGNVVIPIDKGLSYGYWDLHPAVASDGGYIGYSLNVFTITEVEGGYTIQDAYGRYHYMTTYNSFSISMDIQSNKSHVWRISLQEDGSYAITNSVTDKTVQLSSSGTYAPYTSITGGFPYLVKAEKVAEAYEYKYDPTDLSYTIDGKSFKMIYVEGTDDINSFYIMQTEVLPGSDFKIGNDSVGILDADENDVVSGNELMEFFRNIWRTTYIPFRLPTYKEWLYAAKGGHKSKNYKYSGSNSIDEVAWYAANSYSMYHDVAQKAPNELGLYDMSGNYEEITGDLNMYFHLDTWNPLKTDYEMTNTCVYIDGDTYGGTWKDNASNCTVTSWKEGDSNGASYNDILDKNGKWLSNKNHVDARYITIRLVYSLE
ncbi:MAG: hypothetical protein E7124_07025 [Bacteroidales bacterium]|nr:hypothetical protein [Bacteroidales bacterium]